jgi:tetratricopeptide (TPR) repeat protein
MGILASLSFAQESNFSPYEQGRLFYQLQEYQATIEVLEKALTQQKSDGKFYHLIARSHLKLSQPKQAIKAFKKTISLNKKHKKSYLALAKIYLDLQQSKKALAIYKSANIAFPNSVDFLHKQGRIYKTLKQYKLAINTYKKAPIIKKDFAVYYDLGLAYGILNQSKKALKFYQNAYKIRPDKFEILQEIGVQYIALNDT